MERKKILNTRQYLRQISVITRKIENKDAERYKLEQLAQRLSAPIGGERVQTSHNPDAMADTVVRIIEVEKEIDSLVRDLLIVQSEVIKTIDSLPNQNWVDVLHKQYVEGKSLRETADKMGYSVDYVKHMSQTAIKQVKNIKGFEY